MLILIEKTLTDAPRSRICNLGRHMVRRVFNISLAHWQREQRALQMYLMSSLHTVDTLGMVIQIGCSLL